MNAAKWKTDPGLRLSKGYVLMLFMFSQAKLVRLRNQRDDMQEQAEHADRMAAELAGLRQEMLHVASAPAGLASSGTQAAAAETSARSSGGTAADGDWHLVAPHSAPVTSAGEEGNHDEAAEGIMAAHLEQVRVRHAALVAQREELLQLSAESQLLLKDNEVLRMQVNVAVSMYGSAAVDPPAGDREAPEPTADGGSDPVVSGAAPLPAPNPAAAAPLDVLFQRMRVLESQSLGLQARNEELEGEAGSLRAALEASLSRLDAFKGLAATVGMIRGKKPGSFSALGS